MERHKGGYFGRGHSLRTAWRPDERAVRRRQWGDQSQTCDRLGKLREMKWEGTKAVGNEGF